MFRRFLVAVSAVTLSASIAYSDPPQQLRWISIVSDSRDIVHEIIRSEVENRDHFSTAREDKDNQKAIEREKESEAQEYKSSIIGASKEFARAKKKRDEVTSQFHSASIEYDESAKGIKTIRATIENLEGQIERYQQDHASQNEALKKWLKTEKQGEVVVAVTYTRGFKDSAHELEAAADRASAPLIAQHVGTCIESFSKVLNGVADLDLVRATEEGSFKWNNEEPLRIELEKNERGTTYLRLKRYELYPFQENNGQKGKTAALPAQKVNAAVINSRQDLDSFLAASGLSSNVAESQRFDALIKDTQQGNAAAEEGLREQVKAFQDRITLLRQKITAAKEDCQTQKALLRRKEDTYHKMSLDVAAIRERRDQAERDFQMAQTALNEKKRSHESIIVKTAVANAKGSQTPAEASAEAILDKLAEVKNDAKTQHSSSTTEVTNLTVTSDSSTHSITEARIVGIRLISFLNEGDSVRVKMAFRVKTLLDDETPTQQTTAQKPADEADRELKGPAKVPGQAAEPRREFLVEPLPAREQTAAVPGKLQEDAKQSGGSRAARKLEETGGGSGAAGESDTLGVTFNVGKPVVANDGLHLVVEVKNNLTERRRVAFYDASFGNWPKSSIVDRSGNAYQTSAAFLLQDGRKTPVAEVEKKGRVEVGPGTPVLMELVFENYPSDVPDLDIKLHPFIYYKSGWFERYEEFDLPTRLPFAQGKARAEEAARKRALRRAATPLASKNALGCSFNLHRVEVGKDGLHLFLEVVNMDQQARKVAFYDSSFGSWPRTKVADHTGRDHVTSKAYVVKDGRKILMVDVDKKGHGFSLGPQDAVDMELIFDTVPADATKLTISLHPFIYYLRGTSEKWEEFELPIDATLSSEQPKRKVAAQKPQVAVEQAQVPVQQSLVPAQQSLVPAQQPKAAQAKGKVGKKKRK